MKVLKTGTMPEGTHIQIEDWSDDYNFVPYGNMLASYPKSKATHEGQYSPKGNEIYRFSFEFNSNEDAEKMFSDLLNGGKELSDLKAFLKESEYKDCI